jgi:hypothetical protein
MSKSNDNDPRQSQPEQTWANLLRSDQSERASEGPTAWEKAAAALAGVAAFTGEFAKEQIHAAGQDLVSRVLLGESYTPPLGEKDKEQEHDKDKGIDR